MVTTVQYVGRANVRSISVAEWLAGGITAPEDVRWDATNGFAWTQSRLNAAEIAYLDADPEFEIGMTGPRTDPVAASDVVVYQSQLDEAVTGLLGSISTTYVTFDGTNLKLAGATIPTSGGTSATDNDLGGINFSSGATDNGLGGIAA